MPTNKTNNQQPEKEETLYCDRQNGSKGKECKCICHQESYPLPKDFNKINEIKICGHYSENFEPCKICNVSHPEPSESWEIKFNETYEIKEIGNYSEQVIPNSATPRPIKPFIKSLILSERTALVENLRQLPHHKMQGDRWCILIEDLEDIINLLTKNK